MNTRKAQSTRTAKAGTNKAQAAMPSVQELLAQMAAMQAQLQALTQEPSTKGKAKGKTNKAQAETKTPEQLRNERIREYVKSVENLSLAQLCKQIGPIAKANKARGTQINDWEDGHVPTADALLYLPIEKRSAFKAAWKKAKKAGSINSRSQALAMLAKAM